MGNYPPYTATGGVNDGVFGCNATLGTCMHLRGVKGAIIIGVMIATFISWLPDTRVSYWDDNVEPLGGGAGKGGGEYRFDYFKKVVKVEPIDMTAGKFDFDWAGGKIIEALFIFFF